MKIYTKKMEKPFFVRRFYLNKYIIFSNINWIHFLSGILLFPYFLKHARIKLSSLNLFIRFIAWEMLLLLDIVHLVSNVRDT